MRSPSPLSRLARWSTISCLTALLACAAQTSSGESAAPVDPESSVRPGVNDKYFADDAATEWTEVLERERRDVITHRDEIVAALGLTPGMAVADVGAGTGAFLEPVSAALGPEGQLYAVDIAPPFLEHLRARAEGAGLDNVKVVEGADRSINLPPASLDLLFMCDVYHHLEYPSAYLRSLLQALRPGGRMVIVEFDKVPGKTSARMMKHVRQDKATLLREVLAEGFVLDREVESIPFRENYMLVFRSDAPDIAP